jgi:hypothetical protein
MLATIVTALVEPFLSGTYAAVQTGTGASDGSKGTRKENHA